MTHREPKRADVECTLTPAQDGRKDLAIERLVTAIRPLFNDCKTTLVFPVVVALSGRQ